MQVQRKLQAVVDELESLGSTEAIAEYLVSLAYIGVVADCERCIVARYIANELRPDEIEVDTGEIWIRIAGEHAAVDTPPVVAEFLNDFDSGLFPELIEDELETTFAM